MKRVCNALALAALGALLAISPAGAVTCSIGGHNETSENFATGGWATSNMTPGTVSGAPFAFHLVISEVAPRGAGTGAGSDSSEYLELYNPTPNPISLDGKYISDDSNYYRIVNGSYVVANATDWALRFPTGLSLLPGRTLVLCVTKTGFAGSGASAPSAQIFLEMKDSNGNLADDMVSMTTNSTFAVSGGNFTNPANNNGEWVVLYCWDGVSDRVCDIDYASWGANIGSNPKMDKSGISIDGPDVGALASAYNADTPAATQSNLGSGTALTKPNTYQRTGGEVSETTFGGNGCMGVLAPAVISWGPVAVAGGGVNIKFHIRWENPDDDAMSGPISGTLSSQPFGVFLPDYGTIGQFNVPPLQPSSFFDVFFEVPLASLPPAPDKITPGGGSPGLMVASTGRPSINVACPPDTNWAGNVDLIWSGPGQAGQVNKHYGDLITCPGGAPSLVHMKYSNCTSPMPWSTVGVCPGFTVTLVNEDFSPTSNPAPAGWTGWIKVNAAAGVPAGTGCCFSVVFTCAGVSSAIDLCSTACDCQPAVAPVLTAVTWTLSGTTVHFQQHWENQNSATTSQPVSGDMSSQQLGVFLPNYGPIGAFNVPPIPPSSFFDVFLDIPLAALPPEPVTEVPGGSNNPPCFPQQWHGNVDLIWTSAGGTGNANYHFSEMPVCPGSGPTYLHVETGCNSPVGASWSVLGICPGFTATLVNLDHSPAPNPLPPSWIGLIAVSANAGTPIGTTCCFKIQFLCDGVAGVIDVCAKACDCHPRKPRLVSTDWTRIGNLIRFHMHWDNPDTTGDSDPASGDMTSQPFGAFAPPFGPIGHFDVPPMQPHAFFDVFFDVPLSELPPEPQEVLPGGGPPPGSPCPEDTSWSGNVDINWAGSGNTSNVNRHFTSLLVRPGFGSSHVHTLIFCNSTLGSAWTIAGLCPGWNATLLNEDFTPAPNPVPANWTGWISVAAGAGVPSGASCCFTVTFVCDGEPGVIDVCAEACLWPVLSVPGNATGMEFGIYSTAPNPTRTGMMIGFAMPKPGLARLDLFTLAGQRVRTLVNGPAGAGMNTVRWDGRGENGRALPPGAYFVTLRAGDRSASRKVVLFH